MLLQRVLPWMPCARHVLGHGRWVHGELQMPADLPDHPALRDGGDDPQHPPLTPGAARHVQVPRGILARLLPVVHSLDGVDSALEVHGELHRNLRCLGAIVRLKPHP